MNTHGENVYHPIKTACSNSEFYIPKLILCIKLKCHSFDGPNAR